MTSDTVYEGKVAGEWLAKETGGKCNVVELQGTVGSSPAINRKKGFDQVVAANPGMKIVRTQSGDFTRTKGKEVMESFIKAEGGGKNICAVYAHNDDMAIGAIQAIKEAGLKPGKDIKIVSIDAVPDIFKAMADGEANVTVELTPNMAGPALDALVAFKKDGTAPKSGSRRNPRSTRPRPQRPNTTSARISTEILRASGQQAGRPPAAVRRYRHRART